MSTLARRLLMLLPTLLGGAGGILIGSHGRLAYIAEGSGWLLAAAGVLCGFIILFERQERSRDLEASRPGRPAGPSRGEGKSPD